MGLSGFDRDWFLYRAAGSGSAPCTSFSCPPGSISRLREEPPGQDGLCEVKKELVKLWGMA